MFCFNSTRKGEGLCVHVNMDSMKVEVYSFEASILDLTKFYTLIVLPLWNEPLVLTGKEAD